MIQFSRTENNETIETLTICQVKDTLYCEALEADSSYVVQVTHYGTLVGLYDLDGERLNNIASWTLAEDAPQEVIAQVAEGWEAVAITEIQTCPRCGNKLTDRDGRQVCSKCDFSETVTENLEFGGEGED